MTANLRSCLRSRLVNFVALPLVPRERALGALAYRATLTLCFKYSQVTIRNKPYKHCKLNFAKQTRPSRLNKIGRLAITFRYKFESVKSG